MNFMRAFLHVFDVLIQKDKFMSSTHPISRRALGRTVAWSAPAILATAAVPAYAASNLNGYYGDSSVFSGYGGWSAEYGSYYADVTTSQPVGGNKPGFTIFYTSGGETTVATLSSLKYYFVAPRGYVDDDFQFLDGTGSTWRYNGKISTLTSRNGTYLTSSNYDIFEFEFTGPKTGYQVLADGTETTWQGSVLTVESGASQNLRGVGVYAGYVASYTLANGALRVNGQPFTNMSGVVHSLMN